MNQHQKRKNVEERWFFADQRPSMGRLVRRAASRALNYCHLSSTILLIIAYTTSCDGGYDNNELVCDFPTTKCGGGCVDTTTSESHCGACYNSCESSEQCIDGDCTIVCESAETDCFGSCVDLTDNRNNCGSCGYECLSGDYCQNGECVEDVPVTGGIFIDNCAWGDSDYCPSRWTVSYVDTGTEIYEGRVDGSQYVIVDPTRRIRLNSYPAWSDCTGAAEHQYAYYNVLLETECQSGSSPESFFREYSSYGTWTVELDAWPQCSY